LCCAAACSLAVPALAEGPSDELAFSGLLEFGAGPRWVRSDDDPDDNTHAAFFGAGHVNIPLASVLSMQLDVQSEMYADSEDDAPMGGHMVGGHLSLRDPDLGLVGAFGAGGVPSGENIHNMELGFLVGGEWQLYLGDFTIYSQAGWGSFEVDNDKEGFVKGWFINGSGRYFVTDDIMIEAGAAYGRTDNYVDGFDDGKIWNWHAKGKMRVIDKWPIYVTTAYMGGNYNSTSEGDVGKEHAVFVGISFLLGADSLKHNDRYGATLNQPMLPVRAAAWAEALD
jgi:hypothetical protein